MKDIVVDSIFCIADTFILIYFFESIFNRRGLRSVYSLFSAVSLLLADFLITFLKIPLLFQSLIFILVCEFILIAFYNGNIIKKTYTVIIALILIIIPSFLIVYIMSWVSNVNFAILISKNDSLKIITNVLSKFFQFLIIKVALIKMRKQKGNYNKSIIAVYSLIMILSILSIIYIRISLNNGSVDTNFSIYVTIVIIMIDLFSYASISFYSELNRKKIDLEMQRVTIRQQQKDIENIIHEYYETLKIRHDIRKYLAIAIELIHEKQYEELEAYLKSFQDNELGNVKTYINTENRMFNAIINQKLNEADKSNIKIECCVYDDLSDFTGMDNLELCLIFLNLLDNAIEAERKVNDPIIKFNIFAKAGYVCFKIENTVDDDILSFNPNLQTTKNNKIIHGIGLRSVREIIDRYDGIFNITQNGKWFSVEIMLLKNAV